MKEFSKNLIIALIAQSISFLASIVMSLLVPKILSVEQFGYWQLFLLYNTYVGFSLLGLNGGIYLTEGGKKRSTVNRALVGSQIRFGIISQLFVSLLFIISSFFLVDQQDRLFVCISTAVYLIISNTNDLIGYLFQAINETRLFSLSTTIDRVLYLVVLVFLVGIFRTDSYRPYIILFICTKTIALFYSLFKGKDFLISENLPIDVTVREVIKSVRIGIKLSLSTIAGSLILGAERFMIDSHMGINVFSKVSFSLSMANFFLLFSSQFAMVLFPELRRVDTRSLSSSFVRIDSILSLILPAIYILYFPLSIFINLWLPHYNDSLIYLGLMIPLCIYDGKMNIVGTTYYKVLRQEGKLLMVNIVAMFISFSLGAVACFVLNNLFLTLLSAVFAIILRSWYSEYNFYIYFNKKRVVSFAFELGLTILFYVSVYLGGYGFGLILVCYILYVFFYRKFIVGEIKEIVKH